MTSAFGYAGGPHAGYSIFPIIHGPRRARPFGVRRLVAALDFNLAEAQVRLLILDAFCKTLDKLAPQPVTLRE